GLTLMVAVDASVHGETIGMWTIVRRAIGYLPKYILTNAHTTVFYWSILTPAIYLAGHLTAGRPVGMVVIAWAFVVVLGIVVHLHTLFAPYMAVHSDLHPTRAAIEGFRL